MTRAVLLVSCAGSRTIGISASRHFPQPEIGAQPMLKRVHNAFYWTKEMDEAVGFYRDVLGLNLRVRHGEDWTEFDVGNTTVALHGTRGAAPPTAGATVVFEVDDLDLTMRALSGRGVAFEGEVTEVPESGRFASFRDPAGNLLQIFQPGPAERHVTDEGWS